MISSEAVSPLQKKIISLICKHGAIPLDAYILLALADPEHGYYSKNNPFGSDGDFITAPEISQMFGEILAIWILQVWQVLGKPDPFIFCEIGPGLGTLMYDIMRTINKLDPECFASAIPFLVENSLQLTFLQKKKLSFFNKTFRWVDKISKIPDLPFILIANELFDVLPIRQYLLKDGFVYEKMVCINTKKELCFVFCKDYNFASFLKPSVFNLPNNTIFEISHARCALAAEISQKIIKNRGIALIIDYGILAMKTGAIAVGDTLQAVSKHRFCHPLERPGECDLTSHVNFAMLDRIAKKAGCHTASLTQAEFLQRLGLLERARQLGTHGDLILRNRLNCEVNRLINPNQMGKLFKFFCVTDPKTKILFPFSEENTTHHDTINP